MKKTEYEMNLVFRFGFDENHKWFCEPTKGQGLLGKMFPVGKRMAEFPTSELLNYSKTISATSLIENEKDEADIASNMLADESKEDHTQANLVNYAKKSGITLAELGAILSEAGYKAFNPDNWDLMKLVVDARSNGDG